MKNRKPFNLDRIIQIYNIGQVLVCAYIVIEVKMKNLQYIQQQIFK